jgi:16S rRNA (uracil1498-N3)-methyltransferase
MGSTKINMTRPDRFFVPDLARMDSGLLVDLDATESAHATRVKRKKPGTGIELFDGQGNVAQATIVEMTGRHQLRTRIVSLRQCERPKRNLSVVTAIPKGDRMETMLDMLTQLNVTRVMPVIFSRSLPAIGAGRQTRWRRIVVEACKQSRRDHLLTIDEPLAFDDWISTEDHQVPGTRWLADPAGESLHAGRAIWGDDSAVSSPPMSTVVIGPEGGVAPAEREALMVAGYRALSLGANILRIETAAVSMAALAASSWSGS